MVEHRCPECGAETFYLCGDDGCGRRCLACGWKSGMSPLRDEVNRAMKLLAKDMLPGEDTEPEEE